MSREEELDQLAKQLVVQSIKGLHEEFGLDKILLKVNEHWNKGHRNAALCVKEVMAELRGEKG